VTKSYHVRVHYRTGKKVQRRVSWFRSIKADSDTDASNKAIQRVVSRKANTGTVEVESVEVRAVEAKRDPVKAERDRIVGIIEGRKRVHVGFIEGARDAGVEPSDSIYTAIAELNAILRVI
jgi:hypothetical protein